jgi:GT2 family glycosyltransferase
VWGVERPLVLGAISSVLDISTYPNFVVVVVADPDTPTSVLDELAGLDCTVVEGTGEFNFSARCNQGAAAGTGEVLLFLNDDTLVEQPDWIETMVGFLAEPDVGVVGARLLYADGTLQHGGLLLNEQPLHIFHGFAGDDPGPFGLLEIDREVSGVTGACLLTPRAVFEELGGFPEEFRVAFNDLDYCLRVRATGRRIIWNAHSTLFHFESQTRRPDADQHEIDLLYARWGDELHSDPYGNPAFAPKQAVWLPASRATLWSAIRSKVDQFRR